MTPLQFVEASRDYNFERRQELAGLIGSVTACIKCALSDIKHQHVGDAKDALEKALTEINNVCAWSK